MGGDPGADLPPEAAVDAEVEESKSGALALGEGVGYIGGEKDASAGKVRRPYSDVAVALVAGWEGSGGGDALGVVEEEGVEAVVIHADAVVGVAGGEGDLEDGEEDWVGAGAGEVELEEGGILEAECGLGGAEGKPDDEDGEKDGDDENEEAGEEAVVELPAFVLLVVAAVLRHGRAVILA